MVPDRLSRRDALSLSGVALVALAGCTTGSSDGTSTSTATERDYAQSVDSPESITVRNPQGTPAVRSTAYSPGEDLFESSATWDYEDWLVTSPSDRDALEFSQATTGGAAARDFIAATDLSETTLLVHQYNIGSCDTRRLTRLKWSSEFSCGDLDCIGIALRYDSIDREDDCDGPEGDESDSPPYSEGTHANETTFIRIPAQIQSYGRFSVQV